MPKVMISYWEKINSVDPLVIEQFAMEMAIHFDDLQLKIVNFHS